MRRRTQLKALRMQIKAGIDAIKEGDFVEVEEGHLDGYLEELKATPTKRAR